MPPPEIAMLYFEIFVIVLLTLANGFLALSELAIVSSRSSRLRHAARAGDSGAAAALRLIDDPSRFLATVQVGITLIGVLAGAFGGTTIGVRLGAWLDGFALLAPHGRAVGVGLVVVAVTYLSIVVGELVPKRVALASPERVAAQVARPMGALCRLASPVVWVLKVSTEAILRTAGLSGTRQTTITEDEVRSLIAEGTRVGIFVPQEREMIDAVLRLADRSVRAVMTPRHDIVWVDADADRETVSRLLEEHRLSRLVVCEGSVDHVIGVVHGRDLLPVALKEPVINLRSVTTPLPVIPDTTTVLALLNRFRRERAHMALVVDEYGATEGVVTLTDVLESIAGEFPEAGEDFEPPIVQREDGSWLVEGSIPIDELEDRLHVPGLRAANQFETLAGFVLHRLGRLPSPGESFVHRGLRFEVVDMDRHRIDKVLIQPSVTETSDRNG